MDEKNKRTYTVNEIKEILGISRATAYELIKKDLFHSVKLGSCVRVTKRSFDKWLDGKKGAMDTEH